MAFASKQLCACWCLGVLACSAPRPSAGASQPAASALPPTAAIAPAPPAPEPAPETTGPDAKPDDSGWGVAAGLKYLEIVRGDTAADDSLPLLIVIHGLGDRPHRDWLYAIDLDPKLKARMILPQAPMPYGRGYAWFKYRFQDRNEAELAAGISQAEAGLARMIEQLQVDRPTRGGVVVCGFSQGGMLSYALALTHPELIQFALPISGELPAPLWPAARPKRGVSPHIVALHGTTDTVVSFEADDKLAKHLRGLGYPSQLLPFDGVGHHISEAMSMRAKSELSAAIAALALGSSKH